MKPPAVIFAADTDGSDPMRRALLIAAAGLGATTILPTKTHAVGAALFTDEEMASVFERYHGFGDKASGGPGDNACGAWLEAQLQGMGYRTRRQVFDVPMFNLQTTRLSADGASAPVVPQAIVTPTPAGGVRGRMVVHIDGQTERLDGAIALVILPFKRWSAASDPEIRRPVGAALAAGASAVVIVTTGPTGEAVALNAPVNTRLFDKPVAVLAPMDAPPFIAAAWRGAVGRLDVIGEVGTRKAFNNIASLQRGLNRTLVISTPRSGWFSCVGERGPGLAVWLSLARWASRTPLNCNVELLCTSGHEYDNAGGEAYITHLAPRPAQTAMWAHIGANVAARDWQDTAGGLQPLPSADPQRFLVATPTLVPVLRPAFAGQAGLEVVRDSQSFPPRGELINIIRAGYAPAFGIFGTHRFHHTPSDDLRCVSAPLARRVADALAPVISAAVA